MKSFQVVMLKCNNTVYNILHVGTRFIASEMYCRSPGRTRRCRLTNEDRHHLYERGGALAPPYRLRAPRDEGIASLRWSPAILLSSAH